MNNKIILILCIIIVWMKSPAQQTGHTSVTFTDPVRNNRQIATEVYYPAQTAGNNIPIAPGKFPLIVFGHGFSMVWSAYQNFWDTLVTEGYVIVFPTTEGSLSPVHADFGEDLKFLIPYIQNNGAGSSVPASSVGTTSAIMGHSMGGGSSFLAAKNNTSITTMVSFAAANTNPSSITAAQQVSVPTLIFSGKNDCVAPPAQHQDVIYDSTSAAYKTQVYITGGGHCYFANYNFNCAFGEGTCTPSPAITRAEQQKTVNGLLKPWLAYYLKGLCAKAQEFQDSLALSTKITYRQSQSIACATGLSDLQSIQDLVSAFPNPSSDLLNLSLREGELEEVVVYDARMQKVMERTENLSGSKTTLDISGLKAGIYLAMVNGKYFIKFMALDSAKK